jgi:hypothetical protein
MTNSDSTFFSTNIPLADADITDIFAFASTFNGYKAHRPFAACAEIANNALSVYQENSSLPLSLVNLRTCLFFEIRRWHHYGDIPDEETVLYMRAVVEAIRNIVDKQKA